MSILMPWPIWQKSSEKISSEIMSIDGDKGKKIDKNTVRLILMVIIATVASDMVLTEAEEDALGEEDSVDEEPQLGVLNHKQHLNQRQPWIQPSGSI